MPKKEKNLEQIYRLMVEKLRQLSKGDAFVKTMEENRNFSYIERKDSYFFEKMAQAIFESGLRAWAWEPHKEGIKKSVLLFQCKKGRWF